MNYSDFDLGHLGGGEVVTVSLSGVESDVMLMSESDVHRFAGGGRVTYWGGHYRRSPAKIGVPSAGAWHVVVVPGLGGRVEANVSVSRVPRAVGL
jgi:Domain of unknown function (DUF1883)